MIGRPFWRSVRFASFVGIGIGLFGTLIVGVFKEEIILYTIYGVILGLLYGLAPLVSWRIFQKDLKKMGFIW